MVQLAERAQEFASLGVNVAGMTYDARVKLAAFHDTHDLPYPLLQDVEVRHVNAYGIRNRDYQPGEGGYGIPYPGILYIGADGTVLAKFAVPGYRSRPPFDEVLATIEALTGGG